MRVRKVCNERGVHEIWGKISVWGLFFFFTFLIFRDIKRNLLRVSFFYYSFSCSIYSSYRSKIEIWSEISKPVDSLSQSSFHLPYLSPFSIRGTPFPENVRKGLGLGDSVRIDRKGSLLDFSNFRKRIMFVNRSIDSLLTRTLRVYIYIYIYFFGYFTNNETRSGNTWNSSRSIFPLTRTESQNWKGTLFEISVRTRSQERSLCRDVFVLSHVYARGVDRSGPTKRRGSLALIDPVIAGPTVGPGCLFVGS